MQIRNLRGGDERPTALGTAREEDCSRKDVVTYHRRAITIYWSEESQQRVRQMAVQKNWCIEKSRKYRLSQAFTLPHVHRCQTEISEVAPQGDVPAGRMSLHVSAM